MTASNEQQKIRETMLSIAEGRESGSKLVFDKRTKTIKAVSKRDPDQGLEIQPGDADMFGARA